MDSEKLVQGAADLAAALKDNPAAESFIDFLSLVVTAAFVYFFISMLFDKFKESRTDRVLGAVEGALTKNVEALGKVTTAIEKIED